MLASLSKQLQQHHQQSSQHTSSSSSLNVPPTSTQGDAQKGNLASEGDSGGNISLYPPSPNVSQAGGSSGSTTQAPPVRSTSSLAQSLSSSMTAGGAPNVTISSSGELPLSVKQVMSAAQTRYSVKLFMEEKIGLGENVQKSYSILSFFYKIPSF